MRFRRLIACIGISAAVATPSLSANADPVSEFYGGRTFEIHVGFAAGGGYDTYARLLGRYIGEHIPGKPSVVVKNRTGSATIKLTNLLYHQGPMDGSVMGMVARGIPTHELLGGSGAKFDPVKFHWVGSMNNEVSACMLHKRSGVANFAGLLEKQVVVGGQGASSDADQFTNFLTNLMGAKFKLITGYPGTAVTVLALDRGEVDGICGWSWTSVNKMRGNQVKGGDIYPVLQMALKKHPDLPNVPLITDIARTEEQRKQMELIFSRQTIGRPFLLPPNVPMERVAAVRKAFVDTMKDPKFLQAIEKAKLELNWVSGEEVQELVESVLATPKTIVAATEQNLFPKGPVEKAKLTYIDATGKIDAVQRGGRRILVNVGGEKVRVGISGSSTKVTINGEKAKRSGFKPGMSCKVSYLGPGTTARSADCNS